MTAINTTATATATVAPRSLVTRTAERFGVEPARMLETLKATAFKTQGGVTNEQMMALLIVAEQYGLNPFTKELFAFPDKGGIVPVVSVDGWARIINDHPQMDGLEFAFDADEGSMTCFIYRKDRAHPTQITEFMSECKRSTGPWQSHPRRMLRHKALIQCARLAFGFSGIHDEEEARRIVDGGMAERVAPAGVSAVRDALHGAPRVPVSETIEGEVTEVVDTGPPTLAQYSHRVITAENREQAEAIVGLAKLHLSDDDHALLLDVLRLEWQQADATT